MAIGDSAGAAGLATYGDSLLVKDIDTALNQRGDEVAAVMTRAKTLEAQTIGVPKFSAKRSSATFNLQDNTWTAMSAGAWATPNKSVGGFTWSGGALTVPRAGVYAINATAHFYADDFYAAGVQVTRNSTQADTSTLAKAEWWQAPTAGQNVNPSVTATDLAVTLNAGDVLRVMVLQRNNVGNTRGIGQNSYDLALQVIWQDSV